jgi:hypothetical protein
VIEILADGLPGRADVAVEVSLREHAVEMGLRGSQPAMDESTDVPASPGFRIVADVDADQPYAGSAPNNLAGFADHIPSQVEKCGTRVGTRGRCLGLFWGWIMERETDGGSVALVGMERHCGRWDTVSQPIMNCFLSEDGRMIASFIMRKGKAEEQMRNVKHVVNGKEYLVVIETNGLGGRVTPTFEGKPLGVVYSVSIEVAQDFQLQPGVSALDELVKIAKDDLDRGVVKAT